MYSRSGEIRRTRMYVVMECLALPHIHRSSRARATSAPQSRNRARQNLARLQMQRSVAAARSDFGMTRSRRIFACATTRRVRVAIVRARVREECDLPDRPSARGQELRALEMSPCMIVDSRETVAVIRAVAPESAICRSRVRPDRCPLDRESSKSSQSIGKSCEVLGGVPHFGPES